ncbi:hypothetical protein JCM8097_001612 [Rhodosporidiobolus ruineniae]
MPRSSRRRSPSVSSDLSVSSQDDLTSLLLRERGGAASAIPGAAGGQERVAPQDVPAREEGPGGGAMSSMTAGKPASRTWLWVTIAAVVLLLVAGGGAAYYFRDNLRSLFGGSSDTTPSASSSGTSAPATTAASSIGTAVSSSAPLSGSAASSGSAAATASTSAASSTASSSNGISPSQSYTLAQNCTGTSFFSCFSFNTNKGVSESVATESGLVNVNGSAAYLRLNSWTDTSEDRPKLYLEMSENMFRYGLVVVDVGKIPWGCGAWSSIFSFGGDWPNGGGIDILEGISLMEQSTPTVITSNSSCKIGNASGMTGTPLDGHTDCNGDTTTGGYAGCSVQNPDTASYGEKWNDAGGGVLASLLDETGLYIWQFPRTDAAKLDFANPDPSSWGLPLAAWPASTCDTDFFSEQTVAVTLGVCGTRPEANWAGECAQAADSCAEYVKTGTNLENMVWQVG